MITAFVLATMIQPPQQQHPFERRLYALESKAAKAEIVYPPKIASLEVEYVKLREEIETLKESLSSNTASLETIKTTPPPVTSLTEQAVDAGIPVGVSSVVLWLYHMYQVSRQRKAIGVFPPK